MRPACQTVVNARRLAATARAAPMRAAGAVHRIVVPVTPAVMGDVPMMRRVRRVHRIVGVVKPAATASAPTMSHAVRVLSTVASVKVVATTSVMMERVVVTAPKIAASVSPAATASAAVVMVRIARRVPLIAMCARAAETVLATQARKAAFSAQKIAVRVRAVVIGFVQARRTVRVANKIVASAPFAATVSAKMTNSNHVLTARLIAVSVRWRAVVRS